MRISDWSSDVCSSDLVLVVTPAQHLGAILGNAPVGNLPLILCSKGIEAGSPRLMSEVAASVHPGAPIAVLSGPTFAHEVAVGLPTAATLACAARTLGGALAPHLARHPFRPYLSPDVFGAVSGGGAQ